MTMYSGYHPDAFWEVEELEHKMEKLKSEKETGAAAAKSSKPIISVNFNENKVDGKEETKEEITSKSG